jgi:hypothetical protein
MFRAYERFKRIVVFTIAAIFLLLIAQKELDWAADYVATTATIESIDQTCAGGSRSPGRWIECSKAFPQATRRTVLELSYVSPADGREHRARVRCDTSGDDTPRLLVGDELEVYAHESEPERMDRRRCTAIVEEP